MKSQFINLQFNLDNEVYQFQQVLKSTNYVEKSISTKQLNQFRQAEMSISISTREIQFQLTE